MTTLAAIVTRWEDEVEAVYPFPAVWDGRDVEVLRILERTAVIDLGDERKAVNLHLVDAEPEDVIPYTPPPPPPGRGRLQLRSVKKRRQRCAHCNLSCLEAEFYTPDSSLCCVCQIADQRRRAAGKRERAHRRAS